MADNNLLKLANAFGFYSVNSNNVFRTFEIDDVSNRDGVGRATMRRRAFGAPEIGVFTVLISSIFKIVLIIMHGPRIKLFVSLEPPHWTFNLIY